LASRMTLSRNSLLDFISTGINYVILSLVYKYNRFESSGYSNKKKGEH